MSNRIVSLVSLAAALGLAACASDSPTSPLVGSAALAAASGSGAGGTPAGSRVILQIDLTPASSRANGKAKWESRGNQRELEIEIEDVKPGTSVSFFLGGTQVGTTQTADALGAARVELSTQLGDEVPASVSGMSVEVRSADVVIASGSFK